MKISVVTPNYNGERFLEATLKSVIRQRQAGADLEYIVVDGGSTDGSPGILDRYRGDIDVLIAEPDRGAADAINKGLQRARGDVLAWLSADDIYMPGALQRVAQVMEQHPARALCFGHCPIINEQDIEIRKGITRFKEMFFPFSCRFMIQCINYVSQPAMFFRRTAYQAAGPLRTDFKAAWDYDFLLRLWRQGGGIRMSPPALAAFRWHPNSLSGQFFRRQFREEWTVAAHDAGRLSPQAIVHFGVWWGIVGIYSLMSARRRKK